MTSQEIPEYKTRPIPDKKTFLLLVDRSVDLLFSLKSYINIKYTVISIVYNNNEWINKSMHTSNKIIKKIYLELCMATNEKEPDEAD